MPVFFVQIGLTKLLGLTSLGMLASSLIYWFIIISFSEEFFKYLVVRVKVVDNPHLDEPLDIMLYMVVAALGFTAVENVLYLFAPVGQISFDELIGRTLIICLVRFIGATFLHTLCSAIVGYSFAISFYEVKRKRIYVALGVLTAVGLHGFYDFSIMTLDGYIKFVIPVIIILTLAFLVFSGFEKLKKMKSICKISV